MTHQFADIAFTPNVKLMQERHGSRAQYARLEAHGGPNDMLGTKESAFLAQADSFYLATVGETGWPYVQHRGGPAGFVKVALADADRVCRFSGQRPVRQRRQCPRQRPRDDHRDGLCESPAAEDPRPPSFR